MFDGAKRFYGNPCILLWLLLEVETYVTTMDCWKPEYGGVEPLEGLESRSGDSWS